MRNIIASAGLNQYHEPLHRYFENIFFIRVYVYGLFVNEINKFERTGTSESYLAETVKF